MKGRIIKISKPSSIKKEKKLRKKLMAAEAQFPIAQCQSAALTAENAGSIPARDLRGFAEALPQPPNSSRDRDTGNE
jgi:hypothetical protein